MEKQLEREIAYGKLIYSPNPDYLIVGADEVHFCLGIEKCESFFTAGSKAEISFSTEWKLMNKEEGIPSQMPSYLQKALEAIAKEYADRAIIEVCSGKTYGIETLWVNIDLFGIAEIKNRKGFLKTIARKMDKVIYTCPAEL